MGQTMEQRSEREQEWEYRRNENTDRRAACSWKKTERDDTALWDEC